MIARLGDFRFPDSVARLYPDTPDRPWVLEVGFGDGRFWPHFAATFPEAPNYLGVELSGVSLLKAHRRLRDAGLDNAILTKMPADVLVRSVIPHAGLDLIVVNFPDPWPKAGHTDHRLLRVPFFQLAASRLKPGGMILLTTDHDEYFEFACEQAGASGVMRVERTDPPAAALETKYALKWRDLGLGVNHARFIPTAHQPVPHGPTTPYPEDPTTVPHAVLTLPDTFSPQTFEKVTERNPGSRGAEEGGAWTVILLDLYAGLRRDGWVVLAHVVEGELTQEVLIGITAREDGTHLVRLAKFGGPIITTGVKAAVGVVTRWLEAQGAVVKHHGY
ncbi:tRNA (guanine-N7)-methyltransferase [Deinococcus soli (ex Cha et al. 2016)]|uniref:tRNA (Guanine-N7-)-methyltransferase n=2 Tax=Deinococcus soli (ex Cha et al. 2016) TaxID=1309411 RepID=A0ACC6KJD0_9DEIO|nr:tRNA (guanine-N7)-methyltransferase [Deinococcus soli (ex Cha et al. 2016)]MDR6219738.1 tRNA (guanine-N7-)-methyltransferase [Deinococcus soli (ex Cha et al. 2016)]MDR6329662.1 tRNA (guanine-N7-)-methyltransferase [Deinococcus soli (ex Cha et al. 2016)]MDR6752645.1 tRNA (guanine-N7-)-methyltransferase [Deinococcus soli (ex Cha et al. 2016)]